MSLEELSPDAEDEGKALRLFHAQPARSIAPITKPAKNLMAKVKSLDARRSTHKTGRRPAGHKWGARAPSRAVFGAPAEHIHKLT